MKIPCYSCNRSLEIREELAEQSIECPACKAIVNVPLIVNVGSNSGNKDKQTGSNPLIQYLVAVSALALCLIIYLVVSGGSDNKLPTNDESRASSSKKIPAAKKAAISNFIANQNLPKMLDQSTRLDSITIKEDLGEVVYKNTIIDKVKNEVDSKLMIAEIKPNSIYNYIIQDEMKSMRDVGMKLRYSYFDKNDDFIFDIRVKQDDIIAPSYVSISERPIFCYVEEKNKHLPLMLDQVTRLEKFSYLRNKVVVDYALINLQKRDLSPEFNSVVKESLINSNKSEAAKLMFNNGIYFEHRYKINNQTVSRIYIRESDLRRINNVNVIAN